MALAAALRGVRPRATLGRTLRSSAVEVVVGKRVEKESLAAPHSAMSSLWRLADPETTKSAIVDSARVF